MWVTSIADFERARELQEDAVLEEAVDQLEALADPDGTRSSVAEVMIRFGELKLEEHRPLLRFGFDPPTTCKSWPGPRYGFLPLHKELTKSNKSRPSKTKPRLKSTKKHGQPEEWKQSNPPRKVAKPKTIKKADTRPSALTSVKSRNPPLHLLGLPAELRILIFNELSLHSSPLEAQIRRVQPCRNGQKPQLLRRFPREPVVAMVNRQVRREVLSIFYGENRFVFEKHDCSMLKGLSITDPIVLSKWMPSMSHFFTHLIIKYRASVRAFPMSNDFVVVYELHRLATGKVTIDLRCTTVSGTVSNWKCLCHESDVLTQLGDGAKYANLMEMAVKLLQTRNRVLFGADVPKTEKFFPGGEVCEKCEKVTFHSISTGV